MVINDQTEQSKYVKLQTILNVTNAITSTQDIETVLELIVKSANSVFDNVDRTSIHFIDEQNNFLYLVNSSYKFKYKKNGTHRFKKGEGIAGLILKNKEPIIVNDSSKDNRYKHLHMPNNLIHKSLISCPLQIRDQTIGVLTLSNLSRKNAFCSFDLDLLSSFADQCAIAINNSKQYELIQKEYEDRLVLNDITSKMSNHRQLEQVLNEVVNGAKRLFGVEMAVVHIKNEMKDTFNTITVPESSKNQMTPPRASGGLTDLIIQTNEHIVVENTKTDDRVNSSVISVGIKSLVGYPLVVRGEAIGVLFLNSTSSRHFNKREIDLMSVLVSQAALAIRLYRK